MAAPSLWSLDARQVAASVAAKKLSALDVAGSALARIRDVNPALNALVQVDEEWTLVQAKDVDARVAGGEHLPMAGVPITVKDNIWVQGRVITQGSLLFRDFVAPADAWSVDRLRRLGAVIVGITNCSEFACKGVSNNLVYGKTRSPWNTALTPGGSSGGAVAGVASGMSALALATDAGGSTRRPAAHCGLVGMKPTFGLIPCFPGFDEPNFGLSVMGQIGRNVEDVAWMWRLLIDYSHHDWGSQPARVDAADPLEPIPRGLRIAWSADLGCDFAIDDDVRQQLERVVDGLRAAGHVIDEACPAWPDRVREYPLIKLQQAGLASLYGDVYTKTPERIDADIGAQIALGLTHRAVDIATVLLLKEHIYAAYDEFFRHYDVLLCPTTPTVSWPVDQLGPSQIGGKPAGPRGHAGFTPLFNYCQAPACSVPAGIVRDLPIGMQVVGRRYEDGIVLRMAAEIERSIGPLPECGMWSSGALDATGAPAAERS